MTRVRSSALVWADPVAKRLIAECSPETLELVRRDAHLLSHDRTTGLLELLERRLGMRASGWLLARTSRCAGVRGVTAVTTVELELAAPVQPELNGLSPREVEVALLAAEGLGNRAIGFRLGVATATVGVHLTRIFRKTGALDRQALTRLLLAPGGRHGQRPARLTM